MSWDEWTQAQYEAYQDNARRRQVRRELRAGLATTLSETPRALRGVGPGVWDVPAPWPAADRAATWHDERERVADLIVNSEIVRPVVQRHLNDLDRVAHVSRALELADVIEALGDIEAAAKMRVCNDPNQMELGICIHEDESGAPGVTLVKPRRHRCWDRCCPRCQRDIAARLRKPYEARALWVVEHSPQKSWRLQSFTLTTDWTLDGADGGRGATRELHRAVKKLVKHFWGMPGAGAFGGWEIGSKGGRLHAHGLAFGPYVSHANLSAYWRKLTGCMVVWLRTVKPGAEWKAVCEAIKYTGKISRRDEGGAFAMRPEDLARVHMVLKGRRRVWCWGVFYNLKDAEREVEQELADEESGAGADMCERGHRMVFLRVPEVRHLLAMAERGHHLKGAIKCWPSAGPGGAQPLAIAQGPPEGA